MESQYLGDGVYLTKIENGIVLTTGNHDPQLADNIIWLEPEIINELLKALKCN